MKPSWKTVGLKHMSDGTQLRLELNRTTGLRRVQRLSLFPFRGWVTLPEELSLLEALMFNCPTRLAIREGTEETLEVCTNNVLLPHYSFLPLTDPRSKRYIVSRYTTVEDDCYWDEDRNCWRNIEEFFEQPTPEPVFENPLRNTWLLLWPILVAFTVVAVGISLGFLWSGCTSKPQPASLHYVPASPAGPERSTWLPEAHEEK